MPTHFHVSSAHLALAVYNDASPTGNALLLSNPSAYLASIKLHSSLDYPKIISVTTGTLSFPAVALNTRRNVTTTLYAHGRPGIPLIFGQMTVAGVTIAWAGSVPIQVDDTSSNPGGFHGFPRTVALGADGTNIIAHENGIGRDTGIPLVATSVDWAVYITDVLL